MHRVYGARKRSLFASHSPKVLEIGSGPGTNLRYYRRNTCVTAVEPNRWMHAYLIKRAAQAHVDLIVDDKKAEQLPFADESFAWVTCSLVLCSVSNVEQVVDESYRVLKPNGVFAFVEHIASEKRMLAAEQKLLSFPWKIMFDGCHLNRRPLEAIKRRFRTVEAECFSISPPRFLPFSPHVIGRATK